ncbi:MAG: hypothetical protein OJF49_000945 [Ktedonobacterales bacterium]|jgi:formylglycine-generating enzyme required for sulfatase activity|nr:MAG: hypothetical protein OJF49_000945 [Ktedonobacterales bacterium]
MSDARSVFVSHSHADNDLCDRYVAALRARGLDVWYDRNNAQNGHLLGEEIQREIQQRPAFVLLMTRHALESFWVKLEIQTALGLMAKDPTRVLLPVRIASCEPPPMLNAFFWIDALALPFDQAVDAVVTAVTLSAVGASGGRPSAAPIAPAVPTTPALPGIPLPQLTPMSLYNLGFQGRVINGVECILPPLCEVPAGVFAMGSDKARDPQARDNEMQQFPMYLDAFAIGRYPVTVAEYACAVRAKAVREPPAYEYQGKKTDWQSQLKQPDHPAVCVSWHDAVAYGAWLAKTTGQPWRLPSEAEWEKAARGTDGRIYPWGDKFYTTRCNTDVSNNMKTTTPVGTYPTGASPYGAQDMAGNVWEWTGTLYQLYPYKATDGRENRDSGGNRILRGGSWSNGTFDARAACRGGSWPGYLGGSEGVGFRLALAGAGS